MVFSFYIAEISPLILDLDRIDEDMVRLLSHFISADHLSVYQLFRAEKLMNGKLHYKSTHKVFQKIVSLKMVERVTDNTQFSEKELVRNPKYYKLSEEGLFTLYIKNKTYFPFHSVFESNGKEKLKLVYLSKGLLSRYRKYDFYRYCLYPWIEYRTIASCSPQFARVINDLLSDICTDIEKSLGPSLRKYIQSSLVSELNNFEEKTDGGQEEDKFPMFSLAKKIYDSRKNHEEKVSLSILTPKEKKIFAQMTIKSFDLAKSFNPKPLFYKAVFSLVMDNIKEEDKKLLKKDANFKKMLTKLNTQFIYKYNTFLH